MPLTSPRPRSPLCSAMRNAVAARYGATVKELREFPYDLAKAVKYFQKALGGRLWETGFTVTITYNRGNQVRQIAAETIKRSVERLNPKFHIVISAILFKDFAHKLLFEDSLPLFVIGLRPFDTKNLEVISKVSRDRS